MKRPKGRQQVPTTKHWRLRGRSGATSITVVTLVALLASSCVFGSSNTLRINGQEISDPDRSLSVGMDILERNAEKVPADFADDARCYFVREASGGEDEYQSEMLCGPVLFVGDEPGSQWTAVELSLVSQQEPNGQTVTRAQPGEIRATGVTVENLDDLWRPDGARPPSNVSLQAPQALPVAANFFEIDSETARAVRTERVDWRIDGPSTSLVVTGVGRPAVIETREGVIEPREGVRRPPDGEEFVVLRTRLERRDQPLVYPDIGEPFRSLTNGSQVTVSLDQGASRKTLDEFSSTDERTLLLTAKEDGDTQLVLRDGPLEQGMNVLTGELVDLGDGIPEVLYREVVANEFNQGADLPFTVTGRAIGSRGGEFFEYGEYPMGVILNSARLVYLANGNEPPSPDTAWLVFRFTQSPRINWLPSQPIPASGFVLTLPDGTELTATVWGDSRRAERSGSLFPFAWGFEVPASFTTGQLVITPKQGFSYGSISGPGAMDFRDAQASWDITIPES